jgi:hypothetical protein
MAKREFTISGKLTVTENEHDHGRWTVVDIKTGETLSRCIRTVDELAQLFAPTPQRHSRIVKES